MTTLIDRDYMLLQIGKAKAENRTFDYDSLIDFVNALPTVDKSAELKEIKAEIKNVSTMRWGQCGGSYKDGRDLKEEIIGILNNHIKELDNDV